MQQEHKEVTSMFRQWKLQQQALRSLVAGKELHPSSCEGKEEDLERMKSQLVDDPESINRVQIIYSQTITNQGPALWSPLHVACDKCHVECVHLLLDAGAQVDLMCGEGEPPLHYALLHYNSGFKIEIAEIVKLTLAKKKPNQKLYRNAYTLHYDAILLITFYHNTAIKLLLESGELNANVKDLDPQLLERNSPLGSAIESLNVECMKILLLHGAKLADHKRFGHGSLSVPMYLVAKTNGPVLKILNTLEVFRKFGGNLWATDEFFPAYGVPHIMAIDIVHEITSEHGRLIAKKLEEMMKKPLSLLELSRIALWRNLGDQYLKSIDSMCIPKELCDFLKLDDIQVHDYSKFNCIRFHSHLDTVNPELCADYLKTLNALTY